MFKRHNDGWREEADFSNREDVTSLKGEEAQRFGIQLIKDAAGDVDTLEEAHMILFGRPTLEAAQTREKTEQVQVRVPHSWRKRLDKAAKLHGMSRSTYLREIIAKSIF